MKNYFLLIILTLGLSTALSAQFGIKAGVNLANQNLEFMSEDIDSDARVGIHAGVFYELDLKEGLFIRPEVLYSGKGFQTDQLGTDDVATIHYLEIPFYIGYKFGIGGVNLALNAGPYLAYALSGNLEEGDMERDLNFGPDATDDLKAMDFGVSVGAGIEIGDVLGVFASFDPGLSNLNTSDNDDTSQRNSNIKLSLHYFL